MNKIPIAILGATGMVGQRMLALLSQHALFEVVFLGASERSTGKKYIDACRWHLDSLCAEPIQNMRIGPCSPDAIPEDCILVLSALDSSVAGKIEEEFAHAGKYVISNAANHRMNPLVPLVIPEVNADALNLISKQPYSGGIVTNPNCCAIPLSLSLAPLQELGEIEACVVSSWQAVSGAGYPGESAWDMIGTVHPHAGNEEEKLAIEPCKILNRQFPISARCVRVPVVDGHLLSVQVKITSSPTVQDAKDAWERWNRTHQNPEKRLWLSPETLFTLHERRDRPSPRFDSNLGNGMGLSIGRIEACSVMGLKYFVLSHNTIRGAAGAAIANAELLIKKGIVHVNL